MKLRRRAFHESGSDIATGIRLETGMPKGFETGVHDNPTLHSYDLRNGD